MANQNHFELTLDTLAPTGSITRAFVYGNQNANMTVDLGDASFVKYWFTTTATGSANDANYPSSWTPVAANTTTKVTEFQNDGIYYYHMQLMDSVDNKSEIYNTDSMNFDTTAPVVASNTSGQLDKLYIENKDSHDKNITNDFVNSIHFEFSDGGSTPSGIVSYKLTSTAFAGDVTGSLNGDGSEDVDITFKSSEADGAKTVSVYVYDAAGNESAVKTATITLDRSGAEATLVIQNTSGQAVPTYINYTSVQAAFESDATDIVGYKAWIGDATEPATFENSQPIALTLPAGDGVKTVHAKVIDQAGNVTTLTDATVTLDQTDPVVTLSADKNIISNVTGNNTSVLTMTGTDATSGVAGYTLKCGDTTISSGTTVPASFNLTSANSMAEGNNTITLEVTDAAGNSDSKSVVVKLDTTAPTVSIGNLNTWYNAEFPISVTYSDAGSSVSTLYAWTSTTENDTTVPSGATAIATTTSPQQVSSSAIDWHNAQSAANYMHVKAIDGVGNVQYAHKQYGFDNVAPEKPTITFGQNVYSSTTASATISYSDATSSVVQMQVTGDITNATASGGWETAATTRNLTLTGTDGMKSVYVKVKDAAGNVSEISLASSAELDTTTPSGSLVLRNPGDTTAKDNPSNQAGVDLFITYNDDTLGDGKYTITGDFTESPKTGTITPASGTLSFTVPLTATSTDGTKNFTVVLEDNAGHTYKIPTQSFVLDTEPADVTVTDIDFNIVSKIHEHRLSGATELDSYADECHFTFFIDDGTGQASGEYYKAFKVCAYANQTAAAAGNHNDPAIPKEAGSINMTGLGRANVAVNAMIKGADLETASSGDGAKIIVCYMQDDAGTWSEPAIFSVQAS